MNETILTIVALLPALVIAIVFHEVAHGWVAMMLGDPTAKQLGRLSFNPIRHVDLVGTLILPGILAISGAPVFGWAKPVPVVKSRLNNPRFGMMAVAVAGPAMNFALALIAAIVLGLMGGGQGEPTGLVSAMMGMMLMYFIMLNLFLGLFNLLPVPPFDGSHIVEGLLSPPLARGYAKLRPYGLPLFFILLIVIPWIFPGADIIETVVMPPFEWALDHYLALAGAIAGG